MPVTAFKTISATGTSLVDGVISGYAWNSTTITYSFPDFGSYYEYGGEPGYLFSSLNSAQRSAAFSSLDMVEGYTNISFQLMTESADNHATMRFAESGYPSTAWAYYPGDNSWSGDVWFNGTDYNAPTLGSYAFHTFMHEIGHALGLKHGHDTSGFGALPTEADSLEFSVMTYRSYVGGDLTGYVYWHAPQSFMMADIQALQHMYGADYGFNSGNTTYTFDPFTGETFVDGTSLGDPQSDTIFRTIWDGGGNDTYDLSNYTTGMTIDLRPGRWSTFADDQLAYLGNGNSARGNIANALLFEDNTGSLIENAVGGSGDDLLVGNEAGNRLAGGAGNDRAFGLSGNDVLIGLDGNDFLIGGAGADRLLGGVGNDFVLGAHGNDLVLGNDGADRIRGGGGNDKLFGQNGNDRLYGDAGDDIIRGGSGNDLLVGSHGHDRLIGEAGNDRFNSGRGADFINGGAGEDIAYFAGSSARYDVVDRGNFHLVTDIRTGETDRLWGIEILRFSDDTILT